MTLVTLDLSTAFFTFNDSAHTPPTGGQYGDAVIYKTTEVPPQVTNYPDFFFPGLTLDPALAYDIEVTFDPTSVHDAGGRGFWLTGVQPGSEQASQDASTGAGTFADLYDATSNTSDVATVTIGPGVAGWDDVTFGVAAGYSAIWFETDTAGAVSQIRITDYGPPDNPEDDGAFLFTPPAQTFLAPLRIHPRSDGLGPGGVPRVWPPPPSVQASNRRAGGYL